MPNSWSDSVTFSKNVDLFSSSNAVGKLLSTYSYASDVILFTGKLWNFGALTGLKEYFHPDLWSQPPRSHEIQCEAYRYPESILFSWLECFIEKHVVNDLSVRLLVPLREPDVQFLGDFIVCKNCSVVTYRTDWRRTAANRSWILTLNLEL